MGVAYYVNEEFDGRLVLKARSSGKGDFARGIRGAVYGLWAEKTTFFDYLDTMTLAIIRGYTKAWHEGAGEVGIKPAELTDEERKALENAIYEDSSYVSRYGRDIVDGNKESGGLLRTQYKRAELWINKYNAIRNQAKTMAGKNVKLLWQWNPMKEHCVDCGRLNGRVYRARVWDKYGVRPQSPALACHGFLCGCRLTVTDKPATSGYPPSLSGG